MKKCYIAGKISNLPVEEYTAAFEQAEAEVTAMGMAPVSPIKLDHTTHDKEWASYMKTDIKAMLDCDCVYAMRDWDASRGAAIEVGLAKLFNIKIIYQEHKEFTQDEFTEAIRLAFRQGQQNMISIDQSNEEIWHHFRPRT